MGHTSGRSTSAEGAAVCFHFFRESNLSQRRTPGPKTRSPSRAPVMSPGTARGKRSRGLWTVSWRKLRPEISAAGCGTCRRSRVVVAPLPRYRGEQHVTILTIRGSPAKTLPSRPGCYHSARRSVERTADPETLAASPAKDWLVQPVITPWGLTVPLRFLAIL